MERSLTEKELEQEAAILLGRMVFAFSRLDVALALYLAWSGDGRNLEELTRRLENTQLHKKLEVLQHLVEAKYSGVPDIHSKFMRWLDDAHAARKTRNELVHGRWGISPSTQQVANVIGLPTSAEQREVRYTLSELREAVGAIQRLELALQQLRRQWPL